jgi:hypothetical protein
VQDLSFCFLAFLRKSVHSEARPYADTPTPIRPYADAPTRKCGRQTFRTCARVRPLIL